MSAMSVVLQHTDIATAPHCNTLQYTATHCNTLQHTATRWYFWLYIRLQHHISVWRHAPGTHRKWHSDCNTLYHTATHCNTLQHTDVSDFIYGCNIAYQCQHMHLERIASGTVLHKSSDVSNQSVWRIVVLGRVSVQVCCSMLQCFAVFCSVLQCFAVWCSVVQCGAVCCSMLQCVAACCSVLLDMEFLMVNKCWHILTSSSSFITHCKTATHCNTL